MSGKTILPYFILLAFTFLLYGNTLKNSYALDDVAVYTGNKYTTLGFKGIPTLITHGYWYGFTESNDFVYRPVPLVLLAFEFEFFKNNPFVNHFFNILIYGLSCVILFLFLKELFRNQKSYTLAFIISLLYLAHPIHTESVANIKGLDEILAFLFGTFSLFTLLKSFDNKKNKRKLLLLITLILFLLGILSKESIISLLILVPILLILYRNCGIKTVFISTIPFILSTVIYFVIRANVLESIAGGKMDLTANTLTGSDYLDRLATIMCLILKYFLLLVFPHPLSFDYSYNQIPVISFYNVSAIFSFFFLVFIGSLCFKKIWIFKKNQHKLHDLHFLFGTFYFFITLSIVSNLFVLVGATFAERFLHTPSLGFCIILGSSAAMVTNVNLNERLVFRKNILFLVIMSGILMAYSYKTINRNKAWKDNFTLYKTDIKTVPNSARAQLFLGIELLNKYYVSKNKNELLQSIDAMETACRINPDFYHAFYNLGLAYQANDDHPKAVKAFEGVLQIEPKHINSHYYLGMSYGKGFNQFDKAIEFIEKGLKYGYNGTDGYVNLGISYAMKGDLQNALRSFEKGIAISPRNANLYLNMGITYDNLGEKEKAKTFYDKAFALDPSLRK